MPTQNQTPDTPPMSWTDLMHAVSGQPTPPSDTNAPITISPPADTMCRDQR